MGETLGQSAFVGEYARQMDAALEPHLNSYGLQLNGIFNGADRRLAELGRKIDARTGRERLGRDVLGMLTSMTDDVLSYAGLLPEGYQTVPVVVFRAKLPPRLRKGYDLQIFSIADGIAGFNTLSVSGTGEDNSRRWLITIDRGTTFGSAYDRKGTVYQHGAFQRDGYPQNIETGPITDLIRNFHDNHVGDIEFELCPELGTPVNAQAA